MRLNTTNQSEYDRNQAIIQMYAQGHTFINISRLSGLPLRIVAQIIGGETRTALKRFTIRDREKDNAQRRLWVKRRKARERFLALRQRFGI